MSLPSPVLRVEAFGYVKRVLRHILASPGYALGKIAVIVTRMERGFNSCQTHHSIADARKKTGGRQHNISLTVYKIN